MKVPAMDYDLFSSNFVKTLYWDYEIELSRMCLKYGIDKDDIAKKKHVFSSEDLKVVQILLWGRVYMIKTLEDRKKPKLRLVAGGCE